MGNVIALMNSTNPVEPLDASKIVPPKVTPSAHDRELSDIRELEQLESAYLSLYGSNGPSWEEIAQQRRERVRELSDAIKQVKDSLQGRTSEGPVWRRIERAEVELEGIIRLAEIAERQAAANTRARAAFEADGRMQRLLDLRKRKAQIVRDPLAVLGSAVSAARITAKKTRL